MKNLLNMLNRPPIITLKKLCAVRLEFMGSGRLSVAIAIQRSSCSLMMELTARGNDFYREYSRMDGRIATTGFAEIAICCRQDNFYVFGLSRPHYTFSERNRQNKS